MFGMDWCVAVLTPMHLQSEKYINVKQCLVRTGTWQCILQGTCREKNIFVNVKQCLVWTGTWQCILQGTCREKNIFVNVKQCLYGPVHGSASSKAPAKRKQ